MDNDSDGVRTEDANSLDEHTTQLCNRIQEIYPEFKISSVRRLDYEGQFNEVLIVNDAWIFRFPRYLHGIEALRKEAALLRFLQNRFDLEIPKPVYRSLDTATPGLAFVGYRMIRGEPLLPGRLEAIQDETVRDRLARQLTAFLRKLHGLTAEALEMDLPVYDRPGAWEAMYAEVREKLYPHMSRAARDRVSEHFEGYLGEPRLHVYRAVLRHGDLGGSNILFDAERRAVQGVIDWGSAGLGDRAVDLAALSTLGQDFLERVLVGYSTNETLMERVAFYRGTFALQEALAGLRDEDEDAFRRGMAPFR